MALRVLLTVLFAILAAQSAGAAELPVLFALEGVFRQETIYVYTVTISPTATGPVTVTIPIPSSTTSAGHSQEILAYELTGDPRPDTQREETDAMGNRWAIVRWSRAAGQITLARHVQCDLTTQYGPIFTSSAFPLPRSSLPLEVWPGLRATAEVQSTAPQIRALATELVRGAVTEIEAVARILSWVQSNVRYACSQELCDPVLRVDASFTLDRLMGNCVNFANLCLALLRAAGIPSLYVNGFVADRQGSHASHAWIAVFFPDLGWVEFESSNWMPAYGEVPVTFLLPQHITLYRGDGRGISTTSFSERHAMESSVVERPSETTTLQARLQPGQAVSWVLTLRSPLSEAAMFELTLEGVPENWHASVGQPVISIDPDGITRTRDFLFTIAAPESASPGDQASVCVQASSAGSVLGSITATVTIRAP